MVRTSRQTLPQRPLDTFENVEDGVARWIPALSGGCEVGDCECKCELVNWADSANFMKLRMSCRETLESAILWFL